jgi:hypothetical protein
MAFVKASASRVHGLSNLERPSLNVDGDEKTHVFGSQLGFDHPLVEFAAASGHFGSIVIGFLAHRSGSAYRVMLT